MTTRTHDHQIKIGSTTKNLKLMRDEYDRAIYSVIPEVPRYQNPLVFKQTDWSGGHGQHTFDDPKMFYDGYSIDTTLDGRIILGPEESTVEAYLLVEGAVADDGGATTDDTTAANNAVTNDMTLLPATPAENDAYYFGATANFDTLYLNLSTAGAGTWTITWEYYGADTNWTALTGVTDNTTGFKATAGFKTVTWTMPTSPAWTTTTVGGIATKYWVRARVSAFTSVTTQPKGAQAWTMQDGGDAQTLDSAPAYLKWFEATQSLIVATVDTIYEYDGTNLIERVLITGKTITDLCEHNGIMYVAIGSSDKWYYTTDADTYTQTDLTNSEAQGFLNAPNATGTTNVLWSFKQPNEVYNTTDGRTAGAGGAALSSATYVGDTSANITKLFLVNDNLMAGRVDGLFHIDADGGVHPLMPELEHNRSTNNFKYLTKFQGAAYLSLGDGVIEISAYNAVENVGPLDDIENVRIYGSVYGISSDRKFLYVAMQTTGGIIGAGGWIIYKGRQVLRGDVYKWSWCPFISTTSSGTIATIGVVQHSTTDRRLWRNSGSTMVYALLFDDPTANSSARFTATQAHIITSYDYGTEANWDQMWQSLVLETRACLSGTSVTPGYRKDTDTGTTQAASTIITNGINEFKLTSALNSSRIAWDLLLVSSDNTKSPEVKFFQANGIERPEAVRIHECVYDAGDEPTRRSSTIRDFLRTATTSTSLVKLADLRYKQDITGTSTGDYVWVVMEPGYPQEQEVSQGKGRQPRMGIRCKWREVDFTIS